MTRRHTPFAGFVLLVGLLTWHTGAGSLCGQPAEFAAENAEPKQGGVLQALWTPASRQPRAVRFSDYVDVHGQQVVVPAGYFAPPECGCCSSCGGQGCNMCGGCGCHGGGMAASCMTPYGPGVYGPCPPPGTCPPYGCNDDMADLVGAGSLGIDQCGPHYFDISAEAVFLDTRNHLADVGPFTSLGVGATAPRYNFANALTEDLSAGWRIAGRYDLGPLSVVEATYLGIYNFGSESKVLSIEASPMGQDNQLFSVFDDFGLGVLVPEISQGSVHILDYEQDLQSAEMSYRRYWLGYSPRVSGTMLAGFRYLRISEELSFRSVALGGEAGINWETENDLLGMQVGGDSWYCLTQGLRMGCEGKVGIYNNRNEFRKVANFTGTTPDIPANTSEHDQVAFAAEVGMQLVMDITPSVSIKSGYQVLFVENVVTLDNNVSLDLQPQSTYKTDDNAFYHGFHLGGEYIW